MPNPVCVTREIIEHEGSGRSRHHLIWCPGCDSLHAPRSVIPDVPPVRGPHWEWNGSNTAPTFNPSYKATWTEGPEHTPKVCHSLIQDGRWQFLQDCTHHLAGQTVPMVPVPDWVAEKDTR